MAELRYIVRVVGKDLDGNKSVERAVQGIKGISHRMARMIAFTFQKETKVPVDSQIGLMPEELDAKLEEIITNPEKFNLPAWSKNRRRDFETGKDSHLVMNDLDFTLRKDKQRLGAIKSYRGLRLAWGLPVRGQRTRSSFRRGGVIGVMKKDNKK
jgi:small subunit ribosomal protein S13